MIKEFLIKMASVITDLELSRDTTKSEIKLSLRILGDFRGVLNSTQFSKHFDIFEELEQRLKQVDIESNYKRLDAKFSKYQDEIDTLKYQLTEQDPFCVNCHSKTIVKMKIDGDGFLVYLECINPECNKKWVLEGDI